MISKNNTISLFVSEHGKNKRIATNANGGISERPTVSEWISFIAAKASGEPSGS